MNVRAAFLSAQLMAVPWIAAADASRSSAAEILREGSGARPQALGNSPLAAEGAESLYWNPALLSRETVPSATLMYSARELSSSDQRAAYAHPIGRGTLAAGVHVLSHGDLAQTNDQNQDLGSLSPKDMALALGWGVAGRRFRLGISGEYLYSKIVQSGSTLAFGAGAALQVDHFDFSLSGSNWGKGLRYDQRNNPLPSLFRAASSWSARKGVLVTAGSEWGPDLPMEVSVGGEFSRRIAKNAEGSLRASFNSAASRVPGPSSYRLGAGIRLDKTSFDYVWVPLGELGQIHRVSLSWRMEALKRPPPVVAPAPPPPLSEPKRRRPPKPASGPEPAAMPAPSVPQRIPDDRKCSEELYYQSMRRYGEGDPQEALLFLKRAEACDALNNKVREAILRIERELKGKRP